MEQLESSWSWSGTAAFENGRTIPLKSNTRLAHTPAIPLPGAYPSGHTNLRMWTVYRSFIYSSKKAVSKCPPPDEWTNKSWPLPTMEWPAEQQKDQKTTNFNNADGFQVHYAKSKKARHKRLQNVRFYLYKQLGKVRPRSSRQIAGCQGDWMGRGARLLRHRRGLLEENGSILYLDSGRNCTTMCICQNSQNCTFNKSEFYFYINYNSISQMFKGT